MNDSLKPDPNPEAENFVADAAKYVDTEEREQPENGTKIVIKLRHSDGTLDGGWEVVSIKFQDDVRGLVVKKTGENGLSEEKFEKMDEVMELNPDLDIERDIYGKVPSELAHDIGESAVLGADADVVVDGGDGLEDDPGDRRIAGDELAKLRLEVAKKRAIIDLGSKVGMLGGNNLTVDGETSDRWSVAEYIESNDVDKAGDLMVTLRGDNGEKQLTLHELYAANKDQSDATKIIENAMEAHEAAKRAEAEAEGRELFTGNKPKLQKLLYESQTGSLIDGTKPTDAAERIQLMINDLNAKNLKEREDRFRKIARINLYRLPVTIADGVYSLLGNELSFNDGKPLGNFEPNDIIEKRKNNQDSGPVEINIGGNMPISSEQGSSPESEHLTDSIDGAEKSPEEIELENLKAELAELNRVYEAIGIDIDEIKNRDLVDKANWTYIWGSASDYARFSELNRRLLDKVTRADQDHAKKIANQLVPLIRTRTEIFNKIQAVEGQIKDLEF